MPTPRAAHATFAIIRRAASLWASACLAGCLSGCMQLAPFGQIEGTDDTGPCERPTIEWGPEALRFGAVAAGDKAVGNVAVRSLSVEGFVVEVSLEAEPAEAWTLLTPALVLTPEAPEVLKLRFAPTLYATHEGRLLLRDLGGTLLAEIPVDGRLADQ